MSKQNLQPPVAIHFQGNPTLQRQHFRQGLQQQVVDYPLPPQSFQPQNSPYFVQNFFAPPRSPQYFSRMHGYGPPKDYYNNYNTPYVPNIPHRPGGFKSQSQQQCQYVKKKTEKNATSKNKNKPTSFTTNKLTTTKINNTDNKEKKANKPLQPIPLKKLISSLSSPTSSATIIATTFSTTGVCKNPKKASSSTTQKVQAQLNNIPKIKGKDVRKINDNDKEKTDAKCDIISPTTTTISAIIAIKTSKDPISWINKSSNKTDNNPATPQIKKADKNISIKKKKVVMNNIENKISSSNKNEKVKENGIFKECKENNDTAMSDPLEQIQPIKDMKVQEDDDEDVKMDDISKDTNVGELGSNKGMVMNKTTTSTDDSLNTTTNLSRRHDTLMPFWKGKRFSDERLVIPFFHESDDSDNDVDGDDDDNDNDQEMIDVEFRIKF